MTNTPNTLTKVDAPLTNKYNVIQIIILTCSAMLIIRLVQWVADNKADQNLVCLGIGSVILIIVLNILCIRSSYQIYKTERFIMFGLSQLFKLNHVYKYSDKTSATTAKAFTRLEWVNENGALKFKKSATYERKYCNYGLCFSVTPTSVNDIEAYKVGMEKLYKSIPNNVIAKTIVAQSKDLSDLSATYEAKLQVKNLPTAVRAGLHSQKLYFENVKDRVGWMHVIFLGVGYYPDETEAINRIEEVREIQTKFMSISGIKARPILNSNDYALVYTQMFHMKDLKGLI